MPLAFIDSQDGDHKYHVGGDRLPTTVAILEACPRANGPRFTPEQRQVAARLEFDSGSMDTAPSLILGDRPTNAELVSDLADVLLRSHYATLPAGASARVVSSAGEPLRVELTLPGNPSAVVALDAGMVTALGGRVIPSAPVLPDSTLDLRGRVAQLGGNAPAGFTATFDSPAGPGGSSFLAPVTAAIEAEGSLVGIVDFGAHETADEVEFELIDEASVPSIVSVWSSPNAAGPWDMVGLREWDAPPIYANQAPFDIRNISPTEIGYGPLLMFDDDDSTETRFTTTGGTAHPASPMTESNAAVTASSVRKSTLLEWYAFDSSLDSRWSSGDAYLETGGYYNGNVSTTVDGVSVFGEWLQLDLPSAVVLTSVKVTGFQDATWAARICPRDFVVAAFKDGAWASVLRQNDVQDWTIAAKTFHFQTPIASASYRIIALTIGNNLEYELGRTVVQFADLKYYSKPLVGVDAVDDVSVNSLEILLASDRNPSRLRFYTGAPDPIESSLQAEVDLSGLVAGQWHSVAVPLWTLRYFRLEFASDSPDYLRVPNVRLKFVPDPESTINLPIPRTMSRFWKFNLDPASSSIGLREIRMRTNTPLGLNQSYLENGFRVTRYVDTTMIEANSLPQPRPFPAMLLDGATSSTLINTPDGTLHHTSQITMGGMCRATPGDLIVNHVMGGLSDLRLLVDGEGTHGFTAAMGFDAGTDLPPPAPSRANVFVDTVGNTFAGAMPHHTGSVVEPYAVRAVPGGPRFADPLVIYRATSFTGMSMDKQSQSIPIDAPPPGASVEELAAAWARTLLRAHYLLGVPPADAEASVVSNVASGDPLVVELTMPNASNVSMYEQSISHQVALALGGRVLGRYPDGVATVYVQDLGDDASPYEAEALFDGYGDPFGGSSYSVFGYDEFMEVVVPMPAVPIDHIRMYPSPGFEYQSPRGVVVFQGPSASGPWELVVEHNQEYTPVPLGMDHTRVEMGGVTMQFMRLIMWGPLNDQATLRVEEVEVHVAKVRYDPTTRVIVSHAFDVAWRTDSAGRLVKRITSHAPMRRMDHDTLLLKMPAELRGTNMQNRADGDLEHTNTLCEIDFDGAAYSEAAWDGDLVRSEAFPGFNELRLAVTDPQGNPVPVSSLTATLGVA
jgi:hypothetical protein